jgi:hypothetical protein
VVKYRILPKLIALVPYFNEKKYAHLVLEIIEIALTEITEEEYQALVLPFFIKLAEIGFELGEKRI